MKCFNKARSGGGPLVIYLFIYLFGNGNANLQSLFVYLVVSL